MKKLLLLSLVSILAATSARAQWPFADSLQIQFYLKGMWVTMNATPHDTTYSYSYGLITEPDGYHVQKPLIFTRKDGTANDTDWNFEFFGNTGIGGSVNLIIDPANHAITSLSYNAQGDEYYTFGEDIQITLADLHYSGSSLFFTDNDLKRHLAYIYYFTGSGHPGVGSESFTLYSLDSFYINNSLLIAAFRSLDIVDYGELYNGQSKDSTIVLGNVSDTALLIRSYALQDYDSAFSFIDTTLHTIPAEDSGTITVRFSPTAAKSYSGTIQIITDEPYAPPYSIQLSGTAASSGVRTSAANSEELQIVPESDGTVMLSTPANGSLAIYNILAQQLYSARDLHTTSLSLDTRSWPDGTYIACYTGASGSAVRKFIVRH